MKLARGVLGDVDLPMQTVFFGGGTPTLLPVADLAAMLTAVREIFGLAGDAEVTTEANPESVDARSLEELREAGFTRVSLGMQSVRPHVLAVLDRVHTPGASAARVAEAKEAGFEHVSLDLIYGTPGESDDDWRASLDAAIAAEPDHISAYSLIVEDGTRLAGRVARGELPRPDDDVLADRYLIADSVLADAGFGWYEVSNWAKPGGQCRHNLAYWRSADWWGVGPGAHSHVGGVRWWNVKHPTAYAARVSAGVSPGHARECLDASTQRVERVLLQLRLAEGLDLRELDDAGRAVARNEVAAGLLDPLEFERGRGALTRDGRLLADGVVRRLLA
jgi:putative oxygen-independent coproporphyrinogen III oxidase